MASFNLKNLDFKTAGFWPEKIKMTAYLLAFFSVLGLAWMVWFSSEISELKDLEQKEAKLREDFKDAQRQANNLVSLEKQLIEINDVLKVLINRLPNKNEIPELVVNVSQAAIGNGLEVDLFEPQNETKKEFYAEKIINVKFRGDYHKFGAFVSDVARQPRLVSVVVSGMQMNAINGKSTEESIVPNNKISFSGTVRTYRYLSEEEEAELANAAKEAEKKAKKK